MEKFTSITKDNINQVRTLIDTKLAELNELGLSVKLSNITYTPEGLLAKITGSIIDPNESSFVHNPYAVDFHKRRHKFGYSEHVVNKEFMHPKHGKCIFLGFRPMVKKNSAIYHVISTGQRWRSNEVDLRKYVEKGVVLAEELGIQ